MKNSKLKAKEKKRLIEQETFKDMWERGWAQKKRTNKQLNEKAETETQAGYHVEQKY